MINLSEAPTNTTTLHPQGQSRIQTTADLLGIHHQTLRRWWKQGKFVRPTNINGILLFKNSDILAFMEAQHACNDDTSLLTEGV